ncbi:phosphotransferase enzyme family protein [Nocardioides mesophilus]|uniref:Phosphotransferase n=1 Tax=Nocardioides mesophilus TaxID=433659 RepID=A0A7G9R6D8_9ACTN|nr:phosphotransferase [Nocardioides mesophilus]QNN51163.1 phosphotransferase [Nocardioides mesophilus]
MTDTCELLHQFWGMPDAEVKPLGGGMNSETWLVEHQGSTYVAKRVPPSAVADLVAGGEVAATLARAGFVTGPPVPTRDGRLVLVEHALALLEHVPGRELDGESDEEQRWIAETLAGVHTAGMPELGSRTATFQADWLSLRLPGVDAHAWLGRAIEGVRAETDPMAVTWSVLHTDPAPEAFVHDDITGVTGLIDWAGAKRGPVLYDVASAVMYLGGPVRARAFLMIYEALGPQVAGELQLLDAFRRFRWAVQGAYFAWRLAAHDLTGGVEQADNERGLANARCGLDDLGLDVT